jgi:PKD repeat protein
MNRMLTCSATFAASVLVVLSGCGGGGEQSGKAQTPTTVAAAAPAPTTAAAPAPTTAPGAPTAPGSTVAGQAADEEAPLLAWAEGDPEDGKAPLDVQFNADIEGGKAPLKYTWKFGDGTPDSTEKNPKHKYEKAGKYRADLSVADSSGDSDSDYVEITVN